MCKQNGKLFFFGFITFYFLLLLSILFYVILSDGLQKCQVMVISLGCCCRHGGGVPQSPDNCSSCNVQGKMREGGLDGGKGMVSDVVGVQSLGGREMFSSMREGIYVCVVMVVLIVVVGVVVLMVVVGVLGVVVLTVVVGVVVLMIVKGVLYMGAVEVDSSGMIEIFMLGRFFVVAVVEVELVVGCVVSLVLWCSNGRGIFCDVLAGYRLK